MTTLAEPVVEETIVDTVAETVAEPSARGEPAWISKTSGIEGADKGPSYRSSAMRSMLTLVLFIAALWGAQTWLRRRMASAAVPVGAELRVRARVKLGVRQELVVVEWGNEEMVLGVGATFIQPLHVRGLVRPSADDVEKGEG